jgi:CRP/FNR family transcriptional regulator, cyclic AMP receptor protein
MQDLLTLAQGFPQRSMEPGERLIVEGADRRGLFVLLDGALRIEKGGVRIATVTEPGACVGEMSLLLGVAATADVVASAPSTVAVIEDAESMLEGDSGLSLTLATLLARKLQVMTTYLVDIKQQYADHEGGLGMVDVVLDSLMRSGGKRTELGSDRDPDPEF